MRKMATIRKIDDIRPIVGADAIECAVVGGWTVVIKKGEFKVGDLAVYCEIDSWIPHDLAPFLSKGQEPREFNGVAGERLRTVKLRGQLSQGLLIKVGECFGDTVVLSASDATPYQEGDDVSAALCIQKYEPPVPAQLAGEVRGMFPSFIPKTDQERIQNLTAELEEWRSLSWEVTEKLDGSSMTVYAVADDEGVCSRNLNLKPNPNNSLWSVAIRNNLIAKIRSTGRNLALQGEIIGEGIQGNRYKIRGQEFYLFDIYDIDAGRYLNPAERGALAKTLDIRHTPVLKSDEVLEVCNVGHILKWAEGVATWGGMEREGIVFKCNEREVSFKAISNVYLLKGGE
jgi:RNA ligase (TIGR02306 family)